MQQGFCTPALHRRYDGPIPPFAAVSADHTAPWADQLSNRRRWAWAEVRRIGHHAVHVGRAWRRTGDRRHRHHWVRLRRELVFALRSWAAYRDWARAAARPADGVILPARNDRQQWSP